MATSTHAFNTKRDGSEFDISIEEMVWNKGKVIPDFSPTVWRWDRCGKVMKFSEYGNRDSEHGWEIDHINPVDNGGIDDLTNLQPLQWENNVKKGSKINWNCS